MKYTFFSIIVSFFVCSTCLAATTITLEGNGGRQVSRLFALDSGYYEIDVTGVLEIGTSCLSGAISKGKADNFEAHLFDAQDSGATGRTVQARKRLWFSKGQYRFVAGCFATDGA